jgi:hypothetical protein
MGDNGRATRRCYYLYATAFASVGLSASWALSRQRTLPRAEPTDAYWVTRNRRWAQTNHAAMVE